MQVDKPPVSNLVEGPQPGVRLDKSRRKPLLVAGGIALFTLLPLVLWPGDLEDKYLFISSGVCAQRPAHTYYMDGQKLPVEARMVGIFAGFLLAWVFLWFIGRSRAGKLPRKAIGWILGLMVLAMALDGLNATFYDLHWPTMYQPQNWLRLVTGTLSGLGMAGLISPIFNYTVWKHPWRVPPLKGWGELAALLGLGGLLVLAVLSGWGFLFWPLATLTVAGGLWMLTVLNLLIYTVLVRRENQVLDFFDLLTPAALVFLFSLAEFLVTGALRTAFIGPAY